jgi:hypothetical protein
VAEPPAQPGTGDEQHGRRDGVAGDDQLQAGAAGVQVQVDGGQGDVDDRHVQHRHELAEQDGRQQCGAGAAGGCGPAEG